MWAKVFECLKLDRFPVTQFVLHGSEHENAIKRIVADQANFHRLNLVCKRFRQMFLDYSELSAELVVPELNASRLPSLLLWLRRHSGTALKFAALAGELHQETTIGALSCSMTQLPEIYLVRASVCGLLGLSAFKCLTSCNLNSPSSGSLDLQALQGLTSLQNLHLAGGAFNQLFLNAELTYLCMSSATVSCTAHTTGLQRLFMESSDLVGLHPQGLPGCTSLRCLDIEYSEIRAEHVEDDLVVEPLRLCIPERMSCLTQLSSMYIDLTFWGQKAKQDDLGWVCGLTSLRRLEVAVAGPIEITQDLMNLVNLTQLHLTCHMHGDRRWGDCLASYFVDWTPLQVLKEVIFCGVSAFDDRILQLASLECLELVCLAKLHLNDKSVHYLARLAYKLAQRSNVTFKLDGERVS